MARWTTLAAALFVGLSCASAGGQDAKPGPLRIFLRGGPKTHGAGEHDHPLRRGVDELLAARGAVVDGALKFPTAAQLAKTDVLVMYAAEAARSPARSATPRGVPRSAAAASSRSTTRSAATTRTGSRPSSAARGSTALEVARGPIGALRRRLRAPDHRGVAELRHRRRDLLGPPPDARSAQVLVRARFRRPSFDIYAADVDLREGQLPRVRLDPGPQARRRSSMPHGARCCCAASRGPASARSDSLLPKEELASAALSAGRADGARERAHAELELHPELRDLARRRRAARS